MIRASALSIVIVISLVIAILCSSLIVTAYYYRAEYQKKFRYDQLQNNLGSGINILLTTSDSTYKREKICSLFNQDNDSVSLKTVTWGIYNVGVAKAFIQHDTLYKTFTIGNTIDSAKWAALYIVDEDRPVSVSGKTMIRGDAYIPNAGIIASSIDTKVYDGDKRIIIGKKFDSKKILPYLDTIKLMELNKYFSLKGDSVLNTDSVKRSFLQPTKIFDFHNEVHALRHISLDGNIILHSDTTVIIDSTAHLTNVLVFAKKIVIKSKFKGTCQLFARDSILIEKDCNFKYPSCLGILCFNLEQNKINPQIKLDSNINFCGTIFTYQKIKGDMPPAITMGKNIVISGQIYSQGSVDLLAPGEVNGSLFTAGISYRNNYKYFNGYLIDVKIDSKSLSRYYLTSDILPVASKREKILQWLEGN